MIDPFENTTNLDSYYAIQIFTIQTIVRTLESQIGLLELERYKEKERQTETENLNYE